LNFGHLNMLSKFFQFVQQLSNRVYPVNWVKKYQEEIILFIGVILISLFSFAGGYIAAKHQEKLPVEFYPNPDQNIAIPK